MDFLLSTEQLDAILINTSWFVSNGWGTPIVRQKSEVEGRYLRTTWEAVLPVDSAKKTSFPKFRYAIDISPERALLSLREKLETYALKAV